MHNEKKHIVIISIFLCLIVGVVACANEELDAQAGTSSRQLTVQSAEVNATDLDAQAGIGSQRLSGTDATADDSRCPCGHNTGFVDEDGDGVCDHAGQGGCQCQGRHGQQFVDEDSDGACDLAKTNGCKCRGRHRGGKGDRTR